MKITNELKILDDKIKANQVQYDLSKEPAKISALSSRNLDKYEYLTVKSENLGCKASALDEAQFEYSPLGMSLNKAFKKDEVKNIAKKSKSGFNYDSKHAFYRFCKEFDEFKDMPLGSGYKKMKEFNKLLTGFKSAKTMKRNKTQEEAHYEKCRQTLWKVLYSL